VWTYPHTTWSDQFFEGRDEVRPLKEALGRNISRVNVQESLAYF
jgi:hypothetical protein